MNSLMQMMQMMQEMRAGGAALSTQANFGEPSPPSGGNLNNFLGGSVTPAGISPAGNYNNSPSQSGSFGGPSANPNSSQSSPLRSQSRGPSGTSPTSETAGNSGVSADLPEGVSGMTFARASELVRRGGGEVNPGGRPTVLALRTRTTASATYQDTFVVLKPDGTLQPFSANTRPTRAGRADRAMLKPGAYEISPRWRDGRYNNDAFLVKTRNGAMAVGVGRDSNGDGVYSQQEMNANTSSSQIRIHRGRGDRTSSTGCLNVRDYDGFLRSVGGREARFNMVLVNVN